jgi:hypothetical protein
MAKHRKLLITVKGGYDVALQATKEHGIFTIGLRGIVATGVREEEHETTLVTPGREQKQIQEWFDEDAGIAPYPVGTLLEWRWERISGADGR